jgi:hypothetical protein
MKTLYIKKIIIIIKFEKSSSINSIDKKIKLLNKIILGSLGTIFYKTLYKKKIVIIIKLVKNSSVNARTYK